jgi:surface antigen
MIVLGATMLALPLGGCSGFSLGGAAEAPAPAPANPASPATPTGAALGALLGGPVGSALTETDRESAYQAQIEALDGGQRKSWRGEHGVFGFVEPGPAAGGDGCRSYAPTIYIGGRPNKGHGVGCKQPDGGWKMGS